jgi:hypothetical protein
MIDDRKELLRRIGVLEGMCVTMALSYTSRCCTETSAEVRKEVIRRAAFAELRSPWPIAVRTELVQQPIADVEVGIAHHELCNRQAPIGGCYDA